MVTDDMREDLQDLLEEVANDTEVEVERLIGKPKGRDAIQARMKLWRRLTRLGWEPLDIAAEFRQPLSNVWNALHRENIPSTAVKLTGVNCKQKGMPSDAEYRWHMAQRKHDKLDCETYLDCLDGAARKNASCVCRKDCEKYINGRKVA